MKLAYARSQGADCHWRLRRKATGHKNSQWPPPGRRWGVAASAGNGVNAAPPDVVIVGAGELATPSSGPARTSQSSHTLPHARAHVHARKCVQVRCRGPPCVQACRNLLMLIKSSQVVLSPRRLREADCDRDLHCSKDTITTVLSARDVLVSPLPFRRGK